MRLESSYIRTTALGLTQGRAGCVTMPALGDVGHGGAGHAPNPTTGATTTAGYKWKEGICYNTRTGLPYPGNQKLSNCYAFFGPYKEPAGWAAVLDFAKKKFLGEGTQQYAGAQPSITTSSLLVPAVVVVGGVALFLILRKKK